MWKFLLVFIETMAVSRATVAEEAPQMVVAVPTQTRHSCLHTLYTYSFFIRHFC